MNSIKNNNPLLDNTFLLELDSYRNRITYARITSLTLDSYPIECIEGVVTDGSVTIDGNSSVRRICSLTMTTKNVNLNNVYWGVTTRVRIEIGLARNFKSTLNDIATSNISKLGLADLKNENFDLSLEDLMSLNLMDKYDKYPDIIWFPLGVYILTDFKTSSQVNNYIITLTGKDKMCLLNGDIGGVFNAETDLGEEEIQQEDGNYAKVKRSIPYIIREMIHFYAQEPFNNIIIKDINDLALEVIKNNYNEHNIYIVERVQTNEIIEVIDPTIDKIYNNFVQKEHPTVNINFHNLDSGFVFAIRVDEDDIGLLHPDELGRYPTIISEVQEDEQGRKRYIDCVVIKIEPGEDVGYQIRELTYPDDLIAAAGETVTSVLDKIVKQFGAYEYFYNLEGQFVFQAKRTYVNTAWNNIIKYDDESFVEPAMISSMVEYSFEGSILTTAYQNTPNIGKVKNDYTVWGKKKSSAGIDEPIHMRYAIDKKPFFYRTYDDKIYMTEEFSDQYFGDNSPETGKQYRVHPIPNYLTPKKSWWQIHDWQQYYLAVTEKPPTGAMMKYQAAKNRGYNKRIKFTTEDSEFANDPNHILIVAFENQPTSIEQQEEYVVYLRTFPCFIFDVQTTGPFKDYPVGWIGWADESHKIPIVNPSTAFQHRFNGCGHTYSWFLDKAEQYGYNSYVYQPTIVDETEIINADKLINDDIVVCDWREIIYQMAHDFYLHNHEDDFYYTIRIKNYLPDIDIMLYQNGHTGYEQYYQDIQGFWRQLYAPESVYDWAENPLELNVEQYDTETGWNKNITESPAKLYFWFDFFDADSLGIGQFSVPAIGDRPKVVNNDAVKAIIYKDIPDVIFIKDSDYQKYKEDLPSLGNYSYCKITKINDDGQEKSNSFIYDWMEETVPKIVRSARGITAQEQIDDLLYNFGYCNENITITSVPIYYLEPNTIISAKDEQRVVNGYYILNKMTIPLKYNGTMQINAIRVPERVY